MPLQSVPSSIAPATTSAAWTVRAAGIRINAAICATSCAKRGTTTCTVNTSTPAEATIALASPFSTVVGPYSAAGAAAAPLP
mmetsp:Transcript_14195/g.28645  ORF Transcript_14195/g.28645 Transcript_14195/m.28645 type:complete len:82 (-) Transcript_14195:72-317(-)